MFILLSPAKTFSKAPMHASMKLKFPDQTYHLVNKLKKVSSKRFEKEMNVSIDIAKHVHDYYQNFGHNTYQALSLYAGQAFRGLDFMSLDIDTKDYANDHLFIIDALYGLISPCDGIAPYRLEMQEKMIGNLYNYWTNTLHNYLNMLKKPIINLASMEYSKILRDDLDFITLDFRQKTKGIIKSIAMHTKLARGMMARHLLMHKMKDLNEIKAIHLDGYTYQEDLSNEKTWIFLKEL